MRKNKKPAGKERADGREILEPWEEDWIPSRDTGRELFFSAHDEKAHGVALAYAALKWGKNIVQEQGKILFHQAPEIQREQARGWSR